MFRKIVDAAAVESEIDTALTPATTSVEKPWS